MLQNKSRTMLLAAVVAGALVAAGVAVAAPTTATDHGQAQIGASVRAATGLSQAFRKASRRVGPSVVAVTSTRRALAINGDMPQHRSWFGMPDNPFQFFFGPAPGKAFKQKSQGTGFILKQDGTIVTNHHVVRDADEVTVETVDGKTYQAKVLGTDDKTDLAVLKIDAGDLAAAPLGDSDALEVGDWVIAVGTPLGLRQTVTAGIVSAKGRTHVGVADYEDFIQTDAAVNPGNSGGPLVNLQGKVVGINTAIASVNGGNVGIGFAIPINMAKGIVDSIIKTGRVQRGLLGVMVQPLTPALAQSFDFDGKGVLVGDVTKDGPSDRAGLQPGDIITKYDGRKMSDVDQLKNAVAATEPGAKVAVTVVRDGVERAITVKIGNLGAHCGPAAIERSESDLGLSVEALPPKTVLRNKLLDGVLVKEVEPGSAAEEAGLRAGDVIRGVGGENVSTVSGFYDQLSKHELKKGVRLRVYSDGANRFVVLKTK